MRCGHIVESYSSGLLQDALTATISSTLPENPSDHPKGKWRGAARLPASLLHGQPGIEVPVQGLYPQHRMNFDEPVVPLPGPQPTTHPESDRRIFAVPHEILEPLHERAVLHVVETGNLFRR